MSLRLNIKKDVIDFQKSALVIGGRKVFLAKALALNLVSLTLSVQWEEYGAPKACASVGHLYLNTCDIENQLNTECRSIDIYRHR